MFSDVVSEDSDEEQDRISVYKKHLQHFKKQDDIIKDYVIS